MSESDLAKPVLISFGWYLPYQNEAFQLSQPVYFVTPLDGHDNFQVKELAHKCPTLPLDKLRLAAAVTMYQKPYFLTTRNLRTWDQLGVHSTLVCLSSTSICY